MQSPRFLVVAVLVSVLCHGAPATAQHTEHSEETAAHATEAQHEEQAEGGAQEDHGEKHGDRPHHKNDLGIFLGLTDEHDHALEPTLGIVYRHLVGRRVAVGALFDYAGGKLRNSILAASLTWLPFGRLQLTAAPGVEFHRGRGQTVDCGCGATSKSEGPEQTGLFDEDATYFVFRLGAGWHFPIGQIYGVSPNINVDFVDGERVWVYGVNFTFAW